MKSINIRNIEDTDLEALKRLATVHHRSLQGELLLVLKKAALTAPPRETSASEILLKTVRIGESGTWSREEMYDENGR